MLWLLPRTRATDTSATLSKICGLRLGAAPPQQLLRRAYTNLTARRGYQTRAESTRGRRTFDQGRPSKRRVADRATTGRRAAECPPSRAHRSRSASTAVTFGGDAVGERSDLPVGLNLPRFGGASRTALGEGCKMPSLDALPPTTVSVVTVCCSLLSVIRHTEKRNRIRSTRRPWMPAGTAAAPCWLDPKTLCAETPRRRQGRRPARSS